MFAIEAAPGDWRKSLLDPARLGADTVGNMVKDDVLFDGKVRLCLGEVRLFPPPPTAADAHFERVADVVLLGVDCHTKLATSSQWKGCAVLH